MKEKYEGSSLRDIANQLWLIIHGLPDEYERNLKKFSGLVGLLHFIQVFLMNCYIIKRFVWLWDILRIAAINFFLWI